MREITVYRLVKSEDLNHHGTLFAGRTAEWFVESSFVSASCAVGNPEFIVCVNIHGMEFKSAVKKGEVICFTSKIAHLGKTSITVFTKIYLELRDIIPVEGFVTFVSVDEDGNKHPHGLVLDEPANEAEKAIREAAKKLLGK
jgi:acyl-CoA hydrolase